MKSPPSFDEFAATRRRRRAVAETDAALSREGALEEDQLVSSLHIPVVMLGVISVEIVLMTYGFVYPALRAYLEGMISRLPIDSSSSGFLVRGLPMVLTLLSRVATYLCIALWLVSFAEAAVFLYNAMGAGSGKFGWRGVMRSLMARPFQIVDMGVMLLNGPIVFLTSTNASEWGLKKSVGVGWCLYVKRTHARALEMLLLSQFHVPNPPPP